MKLANACSSNSHSNVDLAAAAGGDSMEERRKSSSPLRQKRSRRQTCFRSQAKEGEGGESARGRGWLRRGWAASKKT